MKRLLIACAVALAVPAAALVAAPAPRAVAAHAHKCQSCGHVWHHTDASRGNAADHTCPKCNTLLPHPWHKYTGPTPAAAPAPAAPKTADPAPLGTPPSAGYEWAHLPGVGWGWVHESVDRAAFAAAPAPSPAPQPVRNLIRQFTPFGPACPTGRCPLTR